MCMDPIGLEGFVILVSSIPSASYTLSTSVCVFFISIIKDLIISRRFLFSLNVEREEQCELALTS